jgi:hypothetical protein
MIRVVGWRVKAGGKDYWRRQSVKPGLAKFIQFANVESTLNFSRVNGNKGIVLSRAGLKSEFFDQILTPTTDRPSTFAA